MNYGFNSTEQDKDPPSEAKTVETTETPKEAEKIAEKRKIQAEPPSKNFFQTKSFPSTNRTTKFFGLF